MKKFLIFLFFLVAAVLLMYFLANNFPHALGEDGTYPNLVKYFAILAFLFFSLSFQRLSFSNLIKYSLIWICIFGVIAIGYTYRYDVKDIAYKVYGNLVPSTIIQNDDKSVSVSANQQGHFIVDAYVNNIKIKFLVDTGATNIALTKRDAEKLNIDMQNLDYNILTSTANGRTVSAAVKLNTVMIGDIVVSNVTALVSKKDRLDISLLGMGFLKKLKSYEVQRDRITFIGWSE